MEPNERQWENMITARAMPMLQGERNTLVRQREEVSSWSWHEYNEALFLELVFRSVMDTDVVIARNRTGYRYCHCSSDSKDSPHDKTYLLEGLFPCVMVNLYCLLERRML